MYSFHASAAAYTNYWNNTFGHTGSEHLALLSRQHIWQAFIQETLQVIAADQDHQLILNESLPIKGVTNAAFDLLGKQGIITASEGHACSECTQSFRPSDNSDVMEIEDATVTMHVINGIVMGPTHCAYPNCENELLNA
ncbi:hypothetical protein CPB84DRAFT_1698677 [Gymnopilus junonius]|uniref:Uncharacterized protein n=1 Tax=Gymnopilus junonius TaxID=109634 RepID=A0A9P5N7D0_GYMJU|nr:hypothetical protein CPB84DRAFT_1698677 [Gymnopilus junonius]